MLVFPPVDALQQIPWSILLDKFVLDFDILDVVFWIPRMTWPEIGKAFGAVVICKCITDQIEGWVLAPVKRGLKALAAPFLSRRFPSLARWLDPAR